MPVPAAPRYALKPSFEQASPALRFGLLLPVWTARADQEREVRQRAARRSPEARELKEVLARGMDEAITYLRARRGGRFPGLWEKNDDGAHRAWDVVRTLGTDDRNRVEALVARQSAMLAGVQETAALLLAAMATAPFATGLGNEHPLENGFAFLNPYGVPYLPASGVKGVVRAAAMELASGQWAETGGWDEVARYPVDATGGRLALSMVEVLFGREPSRGDSEHVAGTLRFWDVIPQIPGDSLLVEIMTPHQKHYYQDGEPPHDSGQPNPISFLTVPPGSGFHFHVTCDLNRLGRIAPDLAENGRWKALLTAAFEHAFEWLGFGAKTAVGYGAMVRDASAEQSAREEQQQAEEEARLSAMSPEEREVESLRQLLEANRAAGRKEPQGELAGRRVALLRAAREWESEALRQRAADLIEETARWLPWPKRKRDQRREELRALREGRTGQ